MSSRLAALERALVDTILEPNPARLADRERWLLGRALSDRDQRALGELDSTSFVLYRTLVRRTLASAIRLELPRLDELLGERLDLEIEIFLGERLARSHYLRDVAFEFVAFVETRWPEDPTLPPCALDLARHELSAFEVACAPDPPAPTGYTPALDVARAVIFDPAVRLHVYAFPVHELEEGARTLSPRKTELLGYRDRAHEVRYLSLSPLAARIVDRLLAGAPLGEAIAGACAERGVDLDGAVVEQTSALLADLAERGALLGSATTPHS